MTELVRCTPATFRHVAPPHGRVERRGHVAEHLGIIALAPAGVCACRINGEYVPRADWWQPVRPDDDVVFERVPLGGEEGSNPIATLLTLALVVYGVPFAGNLLGSQIAGAAVGLLGQILINSLLPPPGIPVEGNPPSPSPTYSVTVQGNSARLGQPIPVRYGQELFFPDFAATPYPSFLNEDQYVHLTLSVGLGEYDFLEVFVDDTPVQNFQDVSVLLVGPGQSAATRYAGTAAWTDPSVAAIVDTRTVVTQEVSGQDIIENAWLGPFTLNKSGTRVSSVTVGVVFPRGLGDVQIDGSVSSLSLSFQIGLRRINDAGAAIGPWVNQTLTTLTGATTTVVRREVTYAIDEGRYQIRLRRISAKVDNARVLNDMQWAFARSTITRSRGQPVAAGVGRTDLTGLVVRIRASEQLSGSSQRRIAVLARRKLPVYDGSSWSAPVVTRSPAWALADIWRNQSYGRGLPDSRIDLESLLELDAGCTERQDRFDYSFDAAVTTDAAAQVVARVADAVPIFRRGSVYSVIRDEEQDTEVVCFMPRNIDAGSFSLAVSLVTDETVEAVELRYRDGQVWDERIVYGQIYDGQVYAYAQGERPDELPEPLNVQSVELPGVVGRNHALRAVAKIAADALYLTERVQFTADLDAMLPAYGSLVAFTHDVGAWALSGDVVAWDSPTMTLSEPAEFTNDEPYYIRLTSSTGEPGAPIQVTQTADPYRVTLLAAPAEAPVVDDPARERTRFLFGSLSSVKRSALIRAIRPGADDAVAVEAVIEDARRHEPARAFLPAPGEIQDPLSDGGTVGTPGGDDDGGGLGGLIANLNTRNIIDAGPGQDLLFILQNDGVYTSNATIDLLTNANFPGEWLNVQPVTSSVAGQFEVLVQTDENPVPGVFDVVAPLSVASAALNVWLSLSTTRQWGATFSANGQGRNFYVFIRDTETQTLQAAAQTRVALLFVDTA